MRSLLLKYSGNKRAQSLTAIYYELKFKQYDFNLDNKQQNSVYEEN